MQNKDKDWLDDALDHLPSEGAPDGFASRLQQRLQSEGLREAAHRLVAVSVPESSSAKSMATTATTTATWPPRWVRSVVTAAAAALLVGAGYQWGAGARNVGELQIDSGGELALSEVSELYEIRDVLETWDLSADADLEVGMQLLAEEQSAILDELLAEGDDE